MLWDADNTEVLEEEEAAAFEVEAVVVVVVVVVAGKTKVPRMPPITRPEPRAKISSCLSSVLALINCCCCCCCCCCSCSKNRIAAATFYYNLWFSKKYLFAQSGDNLHGPHVNILSAVRNLRPRRWGRKRRVGLEVGDGMLLLLLLLLRRQLL